MFIAVVDCGAESGRIILVQVPPDGSVTEACLQEVYRFPSRRYNWNNGIYWDWSQQLVHIEHGIQAAQQVAQQQGAGLSAIGIDTWGVDFALLDKQGRMLEDPRCYRDPRGLLGQALLDAYMPAEERFHRSGIAQLPINTLNHLAACAQQQPSLLAQADRLLFLPDMIAYHLCGTMTCERTVAATSSCFHYHGALDTALLRAVDIPSRLFAAEQAQPCQPGAILGPLSDRIAARLNLPTDCMVIASAGHDTAAAVAAIEDMDEQTVYCSSGTWSLVGTVVDEAVRTPEAYAAGLSNEAHWDGRIRLNKNIMGLWILQECRRQWQQQGFAYSYAELTQQAHAHDPVPPLAVSDVVFLPPNSTDNTMSDRVQHWYQQYGITFSAENIGGITRGICTGLAHAYADAVRELARCTQRQFTRLVVLGGGGQNHLLNELTAVATGLEVQLGAVEATALGNARVLAKTLSQAVAEPVS